MKISVVIPTLNEAPRIGGLLRALKEMRASPPPSAPSPSRGEGEHSIELIVADGGSVDGTPDIARELGAQVISSPPGRAAQMNAGAGAASGDVLWFLHADSEPSASSLDDIERALNEGASGGFFRLRFYDIGEGNRFLRFIERTSHTRAKNFCLIFGDQGLFLRRDTFDELGGFAPLELMEDWELSRRLRPFHRLGLIRALDTPIGTSARRYLRNGVYRTWLKMNAVKALYILGVPSKILRCIYEGKGGEGT